MTQMHHYTKHVVGLLKTSDGLFTKPRIDYYEFREKWLALFNAASHEDGIAPLGEWVQAVARGNPFMPVDVYKGGQVVIDELFPEYTTIAGGELMFTVPPVLNNQIQVNLKDGKTIDDVAITADAMSKRMAIAGDRFIEKNLLGNVKVQVPVDPHLSEKMDKIFEHFGVKRTKQMDNVTEESKPIETQPLQSLDNNDLDFDF